MLNWQHFMRFLASIRGRRDLAILANLAEGDTRPAANAPAAGGAAGPEARSR